MGGKPTSVNRLLELIAGVAGVTPDPIFEPIRAGDVRTTEADVSLAREKFGYVPVGGDRGGRASHGGVVPGAMP